MTFVITEPCIGVKDASCLAVCPIDCIESSEEAPQFYINPDECIDLLPPHAGTLTSPRRGARWCSQAGPRSWNRVTNAIDRRACPGPALCSTAALEAV